MSKTIPQYFPNMEDVSLDQTISPVSLALNLRLLMDKNKITESELSRRTGIPQPMINRILKGQNTNPKIETLMPISEYFMINLSQLIGEAPIKKFTHNPVHKGLSKIPLIQWQDILVFCESMNEGLSKHFKKKMIMTDMPVSEYAYGLEVVDESMEPKFAKKTILIVEPDCDPKNRDYVIIFILKNKETLFRQILIEANTYYFKPLNPKFVTEKTNYLDKEIKVLGIVIQSRTDFKD